MQLTKHHGLGNDFLVLLDPDDSHPIDADLAVALCDRHRGIGADGVIRVTRGDPNPFRFSLHNEDGSEAEMSGNGISCMAQAIVRAGFAPEGVIGVDTVAGPRVVELIETTNATHHRMRVAMGNVRVGRELPEWRDEAILRAVAVDVGNPHMVCHIPDRSIAPDLVAFGEHINQVIPGGANIEFITPIDDGVVEMSVYERGVGLTQACGTGAVAAATVANLLGLAPTTVTVRQPGGDAVVEVGMPAYLTVPVVAVGDVRWLAEARS